jgi:phosphate-selective porin
VALLKRLARGVVCLGPLLATSTAAAQSAPPRPITIGTVTLGGYLQMDYLGPLEREEPGVVSEAPATFKVARARVSLVGAFGPRVTWVVMSDLASLGDESVLRDASITVRLAPAASVRFGQYTIPYSLERTTSTAVLEVIDRSVMGTNMTPSRDIGVTVFNPKPLRGWLSYSASVINGAGDNTPDDNGAKDLVGRVVVRVPRVKGLALGVNGERGEQPIGARRRYGADVNYEHGPFRLAAEALAQTIDAITERETTGYYLLGVWHHPAAKPTPWFAGYELAARFVDVDDDADYLTSHTLQFGGNYYITPQVRVMNNLVVPIGDDQPHPRTRWWSRVQVVF